MSSTIGELSLATGVPIATLRDWDRRHGLSPSHRTIGNHRRYTDDDAMLVVRVRDLVAGGVRLRASVLQARADAAALSVGRAEIPGQTDLAKAEADHALLRTTAVATREAFVARRGELVAAREALVARRQSLVQQHRSTLAEIAGELAAEPLSDPRP
ncbi:MAG: MerR family transcriptional regulator, light-induced transcriptional regulator [Frankiales bacterium]|nr:MerR family transcriptional regulator, light-induced transcriptional regulator [Frankiales bacterium]MDX6223615.1 MerR family transcriptional regulator, light-induced transcriptional regulator [Frankiales bacterium]